MPHEVNAFVLFSKITLKGLKFIIREHVLLSDKQYRRCVLPFCVIGRPVIVATITDLPMTQKDHNHRSTNDTKRPQSQIYQ